MPGTALKRRDAATAPDTQQIQSEVPLWCASRLCDHIEPLIGAMIESLPSDWDKKKIQSSLVESLHKEINLRF